LICFLIQYLKDFSNFNNTGYPIVTFEEKLLPQIDDENVRFRIREAVTILEGSSFQRISGENLIPAPIWYIVFLVAILLTLIFPMDTNLNFRPDSIILIILIWVPVVIIYTLYLAILADLDDAIEKLIVDLEKLTRKGRINCCKVLGNEQNRAGIIGRINRF